MMYCSMFMALITTSLIGMDAPSSPCIIKEIIDTQFVPRVTLQEMSRLKRTCVGYNDIIDTENILQQKNSYALDHIFNKCPYDSRTIIFAHYGLTKNKEMFIFLRNKEKDLRNSDFFNFYCFPEDYSPAYLMKLYAERYSSLKKIQKIRIWQIKWAAALGGNNKFSEFLKRILPGSGFNIWDINIVSSKKLLSLVMSKRESKRRIKKIVSSVCKSQDFDLLLAIMGGCVEPRALQYIFKWSSPLLIEALREKNAFIENVPDKNGRFFAYYHRAHVLHIERLCRSMERSVYRFYGDEGSGIG